MSRSRRRGRSRLAALSAGMIATVVLSVAALTTLDVLQQRQLSLQQLEEKGQLLASTLSEAYANALYFNDIERVRYLSDVLRTQTEITYYEVFDSEGWLMVSSDAAKYPTGTVESEILEQTLRRETRVHHDVAGLLEVVAPIAVGQEVLGGMRLQLDPAVVAPQRRKVLRQQLAQGGLVILLGLALSIALARALRATDELRESEERLRLLAENVREVLWMTDRESGALLYLSPAYEEIWGRSAASAYQDPASRYEVVHPEDRDRIGTSQGSGREVEYRIVRPDGTARWIRERSFLVRDSELLVGTADDITERKRLESNLLHAQKMESLGRLAGGVAHDFNNLLTGILGFATLGEEREPAPPTAHRFFQQIRRAAESGASLTNQLLSFSRHQASEAKVVNLGELIEERSELLQRVLGEDVELQTLLDPEVGNVRIDSGMFEQILMNFAVNSREAMPDGGLLRIEADNVRIEEGDFVVVRVADTGIGISETLQDRIFEPFFSTKSEKKGTGLGLATCYGIVHQHGGRIELESAEGVGTTFSVYLPRAPEREAEEVVDRESRPGELRGSETILLAEDDPTVRELSEETLAALGYTVLVGVNGRDALEVAQGHEGTIHLLATDVVMPQMSGPELARQLREQRPPLRVLFMSGYTADEIRSRELTEEGLELLSKPFAPSDLAARIRRLLDQGRPGFR